MTLVFQQDLFIPKIRESGKDWALSKDLKFMRFKSPKCTFTKSLWKCAPKRCKKSVFGEKTIKIKLNNIPKKIKESHISNHHMLSDVSTGASFNTTSTCRQWKIFKLCDLSFRCIVNFYSFINICWTIG